MLRAAAVCLHPLFGKLHGIRVHPGNADDAVTPRHGFVACRFNRSIFVFGILPM